MIRFARPRPPRKQATRRCRYQLRALRPNVEDGED